MGKSEKMMKIVLGGWKDGNMLHNGKQLANITHMVIWKIENVPNKIVDLAQLIFRQNAESVRVLLNVCNKIFKKKMN